MVRLLIVFLCFVEILYLILMPKLFWHGDLPKCFMFCNQAINMQISFVVLKDAE